MAYYREHRPVAIPCPTTTVLLPSVRNRLLKQLAAIIAGNLIYFFLLMPHLPPAGRHNPDKLDLGLLVDFWICLVVYGLIEVIARWRRKSATPRQS